MRPTFALFSVPFLLIMVSACSSAPDAGKQAAPTGAVVPSAAPTEAVMNRLTHPEGTPSTSAVPASLPDGPLGEWSSSGRVSGPVCDKGGNVTGRLTASRVGGGKRIHLHVYTHIGNDCLTDTLEGYALAELMLGSTVVSSVDARTGDCPGRGFPWNGTVGRDGDHGTEISSEIKFDSIRWTFKNTHFEGKSQDVLQIGLQILAVAAAL